MKTKKHKKRKRKKNNRIEAHYSQLQCHIYISKYMYIYIYIYIIYIPFMYKYNTIILHGNSAEKDCIVYCLSKRACSEKMLNIAGRTTVKEGRRGVYNINNSCWCTQHSRACTHTHKHTHAHLRASLIQFLYKTPSTAGP